MFLEPKLKDEDDIPKSKRCICAVCGYQNGYDKERLTMLYSTKHGDHYVLYVGFACANCGTHVQFNMKTYEDPSAFQNELDLYGLGDSSTWADRDAEQPAGQ